VDDGLPARSDGRWEGQLRTPDCRRKSVYAHTRRDVLARLREAHWAVAQGLPVSARKPEPQRVPGRLAEALVAPAAHLHLPLLRAQRAPAQARAGPRSPGQAKPARDPGGFEHLSVDGLSDYRVPQVHVDASPGTGPCLPLGTLPAQPCGAGAAAAPAPPRERPHQGAAGRSAGDHLS